MRKSRAVRGSTSLRLNAALKTVAKEQSAEGGAFLDSVLPKRSDAAERRRPKAWPSGPLVASAEGAASCCYWDEADCERRETGTDSTRLRHHRNYSDIIERASAHGIRWIVICREMGSVEELQRG